MYCYRAAVPTFLSKPHRSWGQRSKSQSSPQSFSLVKVGGMSKSPDSKAVLDITESLHLRWDYTSPCTYTYIQTRPAACIIYHFLAWDSLHLLVAPVKLMKPGIDIESWFWVLILSPVQMSLCVYWYIAVLNFTTSCCYEWLQPH